MKWVDEVEQNNSKSGDYFNIVEGDNRIQLLSYTAPLPQVWDNVEKKYRIAEEGDKNVSIKGLCWVLQDGVIKSAKLPYTVVKAVRELQQDQDYAFDEFPMPRLINIKAKNAGTKEVEYTVIPGSKETPVPKEILSALAIKPTPEEMVEKIKGKVSQAKEPMKYPEPDPEDIPF